MCPCPASRPRLSSVYAQALGSLGQMSPYSHLMTHLQHRVPCLPPLTGLALLQGNRLPVMSPGPNSSDGSGG